MLGAIGGAVGGTVLARLGPTLGGSLLSGVAGGAASGFVGGGYSGYVSQGTVSGVLEGAVYGAAEGALSGGVLGYATARVNLGVVRFRLNRLAEGSISAARTRQTARVWSQARTGRYTDVHFRRSARLFRQYLMSRSLFRTRPQPGRSAQGVPLRDNSLRIRGSRWLDATIVDFREDAGPVYSGYDITVGPGNRRAANAEYINLFAIRERFVRELTRTGWRRGR